jgi:hypothetical protein
VWQLVRGMFANCFMDIYRHTVNVNIVWIIGNNPIICVKNYILDKLNGRDQALMLWSRNTLRSVADLRLSGKKNQRKKK